MRLYVGPASSIWGVSKLKSIYRDLAQSPVDYVCLGETICPDRSCFSRDLMGRFCDELTQAGKTVYASSSILVRERWQHDAFRKLAKRVERIEVNSPAFLALARCYPTVSGMFLNVHNSTTAHILAKSLVERIVLPCELGLESIASIAGKSPVATEVMVHGHIPIAMSCTCHTARSLPPDGYGCGNVCQGYPEGMVLKAGDQPMFRIDGPLTLSAGTLWLVEDLPQLEKAGVDVLRIGPHCDHAGRVVRIYRDVLDHHREPRDALEELKTLSSVSLCNGWLVGKPGWVYESPN